MPFATYNDLLTQARDWAMNNTLVDATLGNMVTLAEAEIYGRLRIRAMEASSDVVFVARTAALPAGYVGARRLYLDGSPLISPEFRAPAQYWQEVLGNTAGRPRIYTVEGNNLLLGPTPDGSYTAKFLYYARPAPLSSAVNTIYTDNPDMFLYGVLAHLGPFLSDDERGALWRKMFEVALERVATADSRDRFAGQPLSMRPG